MTRLILAFALFITSLTPNAWGKVRDAEPLVRNGTEFTAHANEVTAIRYSDRVLLWKVVFPVNPYTSGEKTTLETDVQMDIIEKLSFNKKDKRLLVKFKDGQTFSVDISTGEWQ